MDFHPLSKGRRPTLLAAPLLRLRSRLLGAAARAASSESDDEDTFLSFLESAPSSPIMSPPALYRAEIDFVMIPLKGGVNMTTACKTLFEWLDAPTPVAMAVPWEPIGYRILGEDVRRAPTESEKDVEVLKAWWLNDAPGPDALIHKMLLEFRLNSDTRAFRSFQESYVNWEQELFQRLRDRLKLAERDFFVYRCPETNEPAAQLKMAWLELCTWDALDQHPGVRAVFDLSGDRAD